MNVLIIEDDPMVEFIHRSYLEKLALFEALYSADTVVEAERLLAEKQVDLILLDIHLKDGNGLDFLTHLRAKRTTVEVILITAANETNSVQTGLHLGAIDYLIKPFTFDRFKQSIQLFQEKKRQLDSNQVNQDTIDRLINSVPVPKETTMPTEELDKGLSHQTLEHIFTVIDGIKQPFTIQELAEQCGLSHVSVRKYIHYLEDLGRLKSETIYTKVGRPYKAFRYLKS
ncbi:response regulator [Enterococcus sp. AZ109]|uniref:response regulator n=1 Tax=Enterococcus sp. AZ109 TaxID=2774634 RepID=UPI003F24DF8D